MTMLASILAAGSATASDVALKGGMSVIDGTFINALLMGIAAIITAIGMLLWGRNYMAKRETELRARIANELQARVINDPLHVAKVQNCVSIGECNRRMKDLDERVTRLEGKFDAGFNRLADQLSEIERKSEERAVSLHRRLDKISEKTSETAGAVEMIKGKMFKRS